MQSSNYARSASRVERNNRDRLQLITLWCTAFGTPATLIGRQQRAVLVLMRVRCAQLDQLLRHASKRLFNIFCSTGTGLKERHPQLLGQARPFLGAHGLVASVVLVANEQLASVVTCVPVHLCQPILDVIERILKHASEQSLSESASRYPGRIAPATHPIRYIVNHDDPVGTAVVGRRDRSEPLLPCCIPLSSKRAASAAPLSAATGKCAPQRQRNSQSEASLYADLAAPRSAPCGSAAQKPKGEARDPAVPRRCYATRTKSTPIVLI